MNLQTRNIPLYIVLSLVTCGIFAIFWFIQLTEDANSITPPPLNRKLTSGGMSFLFIIVTCGIYNLVWAYKQGEKLDAAKVSRGLPASNQGMLYLLLSIFGLSIVAYALMQSTLNDFADSPAQYYQNPQNNYQNGYQNPQNGYQNNYYQNNNNNMQ